jgi:hypothetical protein
MGKAVGADKTKYFNNLVYSQFSHPKGSASFKQF